MDIKNLDYEDFVVDDDACPHCFWFPCVATLRPNWLGQGCTAMDGNNIIRKDRSVKQLKRQEKGILFDKEEQKFDPINR